MGLIHGPVLSAISDCHLRTCSASRRVRIACLISSDDALSALAPTHARAAIDVDVVHSATIGADATAKISSQIGQNGAVFAARWMEVGGATRGVKTAPPGAGNAGPFAKC